MYRCLDKQTHYFRVAIYILARMKRFFRYTEEQLDKLGNTLIYLSESIPNMSKTKALKLIYILDEISIKKSGIPFLNLHYHLWKYGPVDVCLYDELSNSNPFLLKAYIKKDRSYITPKKAFNDDEFSENDIKLMDFVIKEFGKKSAKALSHYTHRENSIWRNTAEGNGILTELLEEEISVTDIVLNMGEIIEHDEWKKERYKRFTELN